MKSKLSTASVSRRLSRQFSLICPIMPGTAQFKNPDVPDGSRSGDIERHLRRRETAKKGEVAVLLILGLPALLFGPFIVSSIYWLLGVLWSLYVPWSWVFLGSLAVLVPLLFRMEWRSGGTYYTAAVLSTYTNSYDSQTLLTGLADVDGLINFVKHPRDPAIGLVELFLWGPRQILEAVRMLRSMRQVAAADRKRAADALAALLACDHADLNSLFPGGGAGAGIVIAYLAWYDWIGISKDKGRMWIDTESRKVLAQK
jgi:hypothetical protein